MIITKEVSVILGGLNVKHFESLGYKIPKVKGKWGYTTPRGTEIVVKVEHLPKTSSAIIQCLCDKCLSNGIEEIIECTYNFYNIKRDKNEDVLCDKCREEARLNKFKESEYYINRKINRIINEQIEKENRKIKKENKCKDYIDNIRKIALEIGLIPDFKDEEYINSKEKLRFICPIHGEVYKSADQIRGRYRCPQCATEEVHTQQRYDFDYVKEKYLENDFILLEDTYINIDKPMKCYCVKHPDKTQYKSFRMILDNRMCFYCQHEMQQREGHPSWKGGLTILYNHLRTVVEPWKYDSSDYYKGKCVLTGSYYTVIHHLHRTFKSIVDECLEGLNIDINHVTISELNKEILQSLEKKVLELHYKYGFGITLHKRLHELFHKLYTTKNNTPEQFEEFKTRLKMGEFNYFLEENNLKIII